MIASLVNKGALDIIAKVRPTKRVRAVVRVFLRRSTALLIGFAGLSALQPGYQFWFWSRVMFLLTRIDVEYTQRCRVRPRLSVLQGKRTYKILKAPPSPPPPPPYIPPPATAPFSVANPCQTVARVCGSVRIALSICEIAFFDRLEELRQRTAASGGAGAETPGGATVTGGAASPKPGARRSAGSGGGSASSPCAGSSDYTMSTPASSPKGLAGAGCVLLTVAGAKDALNKFLRDGPEAIWGLEERKINRSSGRG